MGRGRQYAKTLAVWLAARLKALELRGGPCWRRVSGICALEEETQLPQRSVVAVVCHTSVAL